MENQRPLSRGHRLVARLRNDRLMLSPDLRREIVAASYRPVRLGGFGAEADRRAFDASRAFERLADLYLLLGSPAAALRCLEQAALAALCGEEYGYDAESFPARFLRIRFYHLCDRLIACRASDTRLRAVPLDPQLVADARRLGGRYL